MRLTSGAAMAACVMLTACAGVPQMQLANETTGPTLVSQAVDRVICEIAKSPDLPTLQAHSYVAAATLTLKAEDAAGLTPSLSFIHPLKVDGTSDTIGASGELSRTRTRVFTQVFLVTAGAIKDGKSCKAVAGGRNLAGDLGVANVIRTGLSAIDADDIGASGADADGKKVAQWPSFGTTIEFAMTRSISGGPSFVRKHFTGIGGSDGLLATHRTDTDTLEIAFAPGAPAAVRAGLAGPDPDAVRGANNLMSTMILKNLNLRR